MFRASRVVVIGAGINGLVAANYLRRAGCAVSLIEHASRVGGACVSAAAEVDGQHQDYALGASVLGLMQDFVWQDTGLAQRLRSFCPEHPKLVHFPGQAEPTWIYREPERLDREFADKWGERGDLRAFRADEARVVDFLQGGYRAAVTPTLAAAREALGDELTRLWITGSARDLLAHYCSAEGTRTYMAMTVTESGPVSLDEPGSAFTIPMMDSGSVFGGYYGFVRGGIWQVTEELGRINDELGVETFVDSHVDALDTRAGELRFTSPRGEQRLAWDQLVLATDPVTAARLVGDVRLQAHTQGQRLLGSAGKLNLLFREPVRWKHGTTHPHSDSVFRFRFAVDTIADFEAATLRVTEPGADYAPGYLQIYCEGAAMRQMGLVEPFDRLAVFFKNLALRLPGDALPEIEAQVRTSVLELVANPEACCWSRLLTPRDLQQTFGFPGGNLDHTMLVGGQTFHERGYAADPARGFYRFGGFDNIHVCGAATYPCGSVAGTPGYMCAQQLLRGIGIEASA